MHSVSVSCILYPVSCILYSVIMVPNGRLLGNGLAPRLVNRPSLLFRKIEKRTRTDRPTGARRSSENLLGPGQRRACCCRCPRMAPIFMLLAAVLALQLAPTQAQVDPGCSYSHPCSGADGFCYPYRCGGYCRTSPCSGSSGSSSCSRGEYLSSGSCRDCSSGKYQSSYSHSDSSCDSCPTGKYSLRAGSSSCRSCPSGKTTLSTGSDSSGDCYSSGSSGTSGIDGDDLADAADAVGDAVCDAIAEHGCKLHPQCCGFVSRNTFPLASTL
eukprot:COSAG02_NODE_1948_length_10297_cov_13.589429_3_plen_270_part_00